MGEDTPILNTDSVDKLVTLVEEATRATTDAPRQFIEPARGVLARAKSRRHHLIFGRRGSGKTSLIRRASADLTLDRIPNAFVDLEAFKGHSYPDVLLSVLIETFRAFDEWLESAAINPASKTSFWKRLFGTRPTRPPLNRKSVEILRKGLDKHIKELERVLHAEEDAEVEETLTEGKQSSTAGSLAMRTTSLGITAGGEQAHTEERSSQSEVRELHRRNKTTFLHRRIINYQRLVSELVTLSGGNAFVFLDDLYHIARSDQSHVLDYFHRIIKGRSAWLKVGTIRHRTNWYHHSDPPIGMKLGDDCDDIDLDITLEKYEIARRFLVQILNQIIRKAGLKDYNKVLADGGTQRLVLASGGVARDFLTIFRKSVDVARERGLTHRGERIGAEDVNIAAGEHDTSKRDELNRDTLGEREGLEKALLVIQQFCIDNKTNCFLVERDIETPETSLIRELVDLRFIHVVASRTTVRRRAGTLYMAYMLDVSQYTGERRRRDLSMLQFWKRSEMDRLRLPKYVLDPSTLVKRESDTSAETAGLH